MQCYEAGMIEHDEKVGICSRHGTVGSIPRQFPGMPPFASFVKEGDERSVAYALVVYAPVEGEYASSSVRSKCQEAVNEAFAGEVYIEGYAAERALACKQGPFRGGRACPGAYCGIETRRFNVMHWACACPRVDNGCDADRPIPVKAYCLSGGDASIICHNGLTVVGREGVGGWGPEPGAASGAKPRSVA